MRRRRALGSRWDRTVFLILFAVMQGGWVFPLVAYCEGALSFPGWRRASPARGGGVVGDDRVRLQDGRTVRLLDIQLPRGGGGRRNALGVSGSSSPRNDSPRPWPLAHAAHDALRTLVEGKKVFPYFKDVARDRYGIMPAYLVRDDGVWIQERMVALGLARVYPIGGDRTVTERLYVRERAARAARRGIWARVFYAVRRPQALSRDIGSFQIVQGRIRTVTTLKGTIYLNFGANWRRDFTVMIPKKAVGEYRSEHGDPKRLRGRSVRVRGWVEAQNGPMIVLSRPGALEIMAPSPDAQTNGKGLEAEHAR